MNIIHYILTPAKIKIYKLPPTLIFYQKINNSVGITLLDLIPNCFPLIDPNQFPSREVSTQHINLVLINYSILNLLIDPNWFPHYIRLTKVGNFRI
jgi:hypothetical protein